MNKDELEQRVKADATAVAAWASTHQVVAFTIGGLLVGFIVGLLVS